MALTRPKYSQIFDSDFKNSARAATTTSVTLTGGAPTVVDAVTLVLGDRVLVRSQANSAQNGIYRVNTLGTGSNGTWGRSQDASTADRLTPGTTLSVEEGSTLGGKLFRMTSPGPITLGVTAIAWTDVSGGGGAASGNNGQIQYNDVNAFNGATYLYYNKTTGQVIANAGIASTSTTTGTFIVTGGAGISGNLIAGGHGQFSGLFNESTTASGVFIGNTGSGVPSPRIGFFNGNTTQNWQVDNFGGTFRWFTPGVSRMELNSAGDLSIPSTTTATSTSTGALKVSGGAGIGGELYVGANVTVTGNVLPSANVTYSLGSPTRRWKDLWLSGSTIYLGGAVITAESSPNVTIINPAGGSFIVAGTAPGQASGAFGNVIANSGIASSSTSTGALVITGGAGISGAVNIGGALTVAGNLTVNGTTTNINTTNLVIEDKNMVLADVATPTDTTADGAGITVKGATDKTFNWVDATDAWTSSEDLNLLTGKQYEIAGTSVLTATTLGSAVVNSSLTSLGTITSLIATAGVITTGVVTNFSTANAVITGGSLNNATIGATTHTTGRFTTVTATTVNAGTIGNTSATLTGTLSTAAQTNITSVGTLTSLSVSGALSAGSFTVPTAAQPNITSVGTLTSLTLSGTITGKTNSGGVVSASNDTGALSVRGDANNAATISFHRPSLYAVNMGLDTDNVFKIGGWSATANCFQLTGAGALTLLSGITTSGSIVPSANLTYNLGSTTAWWNNVYGVSVQAKYADLAEHYVADADYPAGTVVVFGGEKEITISTQSHDTAVAGIISTNPAYLMNAAVAGLPVALQGRVPCRVQGPVKKGDVLVTGTTPGVAQRIGINWQPGCVLGKALETINTNNIQTIEVVVGRF